MGTVGYMSPEQATGLEVDFRSDQFSLGSVLYEMVTGSPAFQKKSYAETTAAILRDEPERFGARMLQAPAPFVWIVERCLAKDPKQRYSSTRDLARDLAAVRDNSVSMTPIVVDRTDHEELGRRLREMHPAVVTQPLPQFEHALRPRPREVLDRR